MAESAALLVDEVLPEQPMRQWVLSFPFQLRFLFGV
ncbi:putative transposase, partial [Escherichia coli DEC4E]